MATADATLVLAQARDDRVGRDSDVHRLNLLWLLRLRWASTLGQACTVLAVHFLVGITLPLAALFALVLLQAVTNGATALWLRGRPPVRGHTAAALIGFDILIFTGLLYLTGGPTNPFSSLYLIPLALAALVLSSRWTWSLVGLTLLCSAGLFAWHVPLPMGGHDHASMGHYGMHLKGMWVALGVAASFIVYFSSRVSRALSAREEALQAARERARRHQHLAALATLAAGAAHELASPLSTIAVVAKELERAMQGASDDQLDDVRLIRSEVSRCNDILTELTVDAGQARGEVPAPVTPRELAELALDGLSGGERVHVEIDAAAEKSSANMPRRLLSRALRGVIENALDASAPAGRVDLHCSAHGGGWRLEVRDDGPGMTGDVALRATEPFFTTKPAGQGMGLGLFLTASIVDQLGGELELTSEPGHGTKLVMELPV